MPALSQRNRLPEWMDQPDLDVRLHHQALRGLGRINWVSAVAPRLWRPLEQLAKMNPAQTLRVLDVACGGGDTVVRLARRAKRAARGMELYGCDVSATAVSAAQAAARQAAAEQVKFFKHDVLARELPEQYDVVMCSLFLHHLNEADAELLLQRMASAAKRAVLVDDLLRTNAGYWMAWAACRSLTRCPVVHHDGPVSVRAAFSWTEAHALARRAGLGDARWSKHWPQRFLMHWSRP